MALSGSLIREARLRAGLSQTELGGRVGKDRAQIARWSLLAFTPLVVVSRTMLGAGPPATLASPTGIAGAAAILGLTVLGSMWTWHVTTPPYRLGRVSWGGAQLESRRTLAAVEHLAVHLAVGGVATTSWPRLAARHQVPQAAGTELHTVDDAMSEAAELKLRATPGAVRSEGWLAVAVLPPFLLCLMPACVLALVL